jgi:hypothetical protein
MEQNFFVYQRRALRPLLRWGVGSSLLGAALALFPSPYWRQFGLQAAAWGAIDAVLAIAGRRDALLKAERSAHGEIDAAHERAAAEQLQRILLVNAGLDVAYIAAGLATALRYADAPGRRGLGHGIAAQGAFLLIFDSLLARDIGARWL